MSSDFLPAPSESNTFYWDTSKTLAYVFIFMTELLKILPIWNLPLESKDCLTFFFEEFTHISVSCFRLSISERPWKTLNFADTLIFTFWDQKATF